MGRFSPTVHIQPFDLGAALTPLGEMADRIHEDRRIARAQKLQIDEAQRDREFRQMSQAQSEAHQTAEAALDRTEHRSLQLGQFQHEDTSQANELAFRGNEGKEERGSRERIAGQEDKTRRYGIATEHDDRAAALSQEGKFRTQALGLDTIRLGAELPGMAATGHHEEALSRYEDRRGGVSADDYAKFAHVVAPYGMTGDSTEMARINQLATGYSTLGSRLGAQDAAPAPAQAPAAQQRAAQAPSAAAPTSATTTGAQAGPVEGLSSDVIARYIRESTTPDVWDHAVLTQVPPAQQAEVRALLQQRGRQ